MDEPRTPYNAILLMVVAMCCLAVGDAIGKHLTQTYSVWQVIWMRSWVWLLVALIWVSRRGGLRATLHSNRPFLQAGRSLILVAEIVAFVFAFRSLPLGDVTAIGATAPLIVLMLSALFLGEKVGRHRWTAVLLGFAGMLMISRPGFGTFGFLTLLPLLGVFLWGIYQILLRHISRYDNEETTVLWTGLILFGVTGAIAPWDWQSPADAQTWVWMILVGVFNTAGHFGIIAALHRGQASTLQPYSYSAIVFAFLIGWFVFSERPEMISVFGVGAIVVGGLYALYREHKRAGL